MKFFAAIMALVVLALSVMPCADEADAFNPGNIKSEITTSNHQNNPQTDNCSPFCQCSCCAGVTLNHSVASISSIQLFPDKKTARFLSLAAINIALPVWQPPQLI